MPMKQRFFAATSPRATSLGPAGSWPATLVNSIERSVARIRSEHRIRRGVDELKACDDRMLADIGLTRGDIEYAARHGRLPRRVTDGVRG
jgi:uncharacterized protein YjiS (DUF1127 family)